MDTISEVLGCVRLTGAVFFTALVQAPWAVASPGPDELARILGIRRDCTVLFHLVVDGGCWVSLDGIAPLRIEAGAIVILPRGREHRMMSTVGMTPVQLAAVLRTVDRAGTLRVMRRGAANGAFTRLVCGYLQRDQRADPLSGALPPLIVVEPFRRRASFVPGGDEHTAERAEFAQDSYDRLARTFTNMVDEAQAERPGCRIMLARLAELMYIDVLRGCIDALSPRYGGWLGAVRDPQIGRALGLMHAQPEYKWTVTSLGRATGVSRSTLGGRFRAMVGEAPMQYLTYWRMQLAMQLLREPRLSIAQVAARVGYGSAVAFHRAFKRQLGATPAEWRRRLRGSVPPQ